MRSIIYSPNKHQRKFHFSTKPKVYLSMGYGGGKTYSLCMKGIQLAAINEGFDGGILAPSLKMLKRDVVPLFKAICKENSIPLVWNSVDSFFNFPELGTTIYAFHSEDNGDSIRGPNLAFGLINEITMCSKGAFDAFIARIRVKQAKLLQLAMSGTPEGFNWTYEYFIEQPRLDTDLIFGRSMDNVHVADSYFENLKSSYDEKLLKQYLDGEFVNLSGNRALWAFERFIHVSDQAKKTEGAPIWVSLDFNVNPMSAVLWNRLPTIEGKPALVAFDEICLNSSDTHEMADVIKDKVGTNVVIFPDPAGNARSTKSRGMTDIGILYDAGFKDVRFKKKIPSVRDCLNASNNMLDKKQILIHPRCKNFIADAEQCILKSGGLEIDKSNPNRSHWLDGFKNMIDYEFPIVRPTTPIRVGTYAWFITKRINQNNIFKRKSL